MDTYALTAPPTPRRQRGPSRPVYLRLSAEDFARLARAALAEERDPPQHARWLIRQALAEPEEPEARDGR